jgi:hypothetical protein
MLNSKFSIPTRERQELGISQILTKHRGTKNVFSLPLCLSVYAEGDDLD